MLNYSGYRALECNNIFNWPADMFAEFAAFNFTS